MHAPRSSAWPLLFCPRAPDGGAAFLLRPAMVAASFHWFCTGCGKWLLKHKFSSSQGKASATTRRCITCIQNKTPVTFDPPSHPCTCARDEDEEAAPQWTDQQQVRASSSTTHLHPHLHLYSHPYARSH